MSSKKKVSSKEKRPVGRPSSYKAEYCARMIQHAKEGGTLMEFAEIIGHYTSIFDDWAEKHEDFRLARKKAKECAENWMVKVGRAGMLGRKTDGMPNFNATMWIFMMKARFGWRENIDADTEDTELEFV